jgi:urease accessory protein
MHDSEPRNSSSPGLGSSNAGPPGVLLLRLAAVALIFAFTAFFPGAPGDHPDKPDGFVAGFLHPIQGIDHRLAMVAVGMWGVSLGRPLIWALPVAFPLVMAIGGIMGMSHMPFPNPSVEQLVIALSVLILGLAVACDWEAPVLVAIAVVSVFAIFHGYAHGREYLKPEARDAYAVGFVLSTGMLHIAGIAVGWATDFPRGTIILRAAGAMTALAGCAYILMGFGVFA